MPPSNSPSNPAPESLKKSFDLLWQRFTENCEPDTLSKMQEQLKHVSLQEQLERCWVGSEFSAEQCIKHPGILLGLLADNQKNIQSAFSLDAYQKKLHAIFEKITTEDRLLKALRLFRNEQMLRIIWRDFNRIASTEQTIAELSFLAEVCIQFSLEFLHQQLCEQYGAPFNSPEENAKERIEKTEQKMCVLGMGKLGAYELNLSSDIDLIFCYPEKGRTDHRVESISNHQFFIKLGQKLINALDKRTADGFVFRVDMNLRPHGESGPLACNFDTLENYYQEQGRSWERYAMIKARVIAGNKKDAETLNVLLKPFIYRRYIDFSAIESLREMKALINREVKRRSYKNNIKLGSGGIREIEFIVQAIQLIRGGRDEELQQREIMNNLPKLAGKNLLPDLEVKQLINAYWFLRNTEHSLQGYRDEQTQTLPALANNETTLHHQRIAYIMGFENWTGFLNTLQQHQNNVAQVFKALIADKEEENKKEQSDNNDWLHSLWEAETLEEKHRLLQENSASPEDYEKNTGSLPCLHEFQQSKAACQLQAEGKTRLDSFMPRLLGLIYQNPQTTELTLDRLIPLVIAILRRSAYLTLLNENPQALKQLVLLAGASPWIAEELSRHPVLLDELLDERSLYTLPDQQALNDSLRQETLRIPLDDLEGQMEALRYFKQSHRLRIAACEITGKLPLMQVSDYLSFLAEAILNHALHVAWHHVTTRHGFPSQTETTDPHFIIVAYGKLGGLELGHNSDLDIIFIHGEDPKAETNHPDNSIANETFFIRLGQRIIHILETRSYSGELYEVDTRLRPSGNSGMLVSSIEGFEKYQQSKAHTWEHQALVRTRVVAGCPKLAQRFEQIRRKTLTQTRDEEILKKDVMEMRDKMIAHLSSQSSSNSKTPSNPPSADKESRFHLKHDPGGIVDIEFLVQYAVLAWSSSKPELLRWTDNIRLLETLASTRLFSPEEAQQLIESYKMLRCAAHQQALQQQSNIVDGSPFQAARASIHTCWKKYLT